MASASSVRGNSPTCAGGRGNPDPQACRVGNSRALLGFDSGDTTAPDAWTDLDSSSSPGDRRYEGHVESMPGMPALVEVDPEGPRDPLIRFSDVGRDHFRDSPLPLTSR